jgi:hypothetical protein
MLPLEPAPAPAPRPWRLVRETSRQVVTVLRRGDYLPACERVVLTGLAAYYYRHQMWPTAMELYEFLSRPRKTGRGAVRRPLVRDINSVRPRLTELSKLSRGEIVVRGDRRECRSRFARERAAGELRLVRVHTWHLRQVGERLGSSRA